MINRPFRRLALVAALCMSSSALAQTWLVNLNSATGYRGASQNGTDANGNLWNNVNPWDWISLQTTLGTGSGNFKGNLSGTSAGVDSYNGPLGTSVSNPLTQQEVDAVSINSTALGMLGGSKAAAAGYAASHSSNGWNFYLGNLNSNLTYDVSFYGANRYGGTSVYSAYSDTNFTTQVQSTSLNVGSAGVYNSNQTATLAGLRTVATENSSQGLNVRVTNSNNGASGYVNALLLYGYIGYLDGSSTTLNGAPAAGYIANGTYPNGDSRSLDTIIGGGSSVTVNDPNGIFYNSTVVIRPGGATLNAGGNFTAYALTGSGNVTVGGANQWTISHAGNFSGNLTLGGAKLQLAANGSLGTGSLHLAGGELLVGAANALGSGLISVDSGTTTLFNNNALTALAGNNGFSLNGGGTFQVNGGGQTLNLGSGNVAVTGSNNLNAFNGGLRFDGVLSGTGTLNWYGSGTLVLGGSNTWNGTIIAQANFGTLRLANTNAVSNATLAFGSNHTLALDVAGTNTYHIGLLTGSGGIDLGLNSLAVGAKNAAGTYSGNLSGAGGITKVGSGTWTLNGSNTYTGSTTISAGTLQAAAANALGSTSAITVHNGGSLLVTADDALSTTAAINLGSGSSTPGIRFEGTYAGNLGNLTLTADSIIDLGSGSVQLTFASIAGLDQYRLSFWNWSGNSEWSGNPGGGTDQIRFTNNTASGLPNFLNQVRFYSDAGTNLLSNNAFLVNSSPREIVAVPEPETWATAFLLLIAGLWWSWRRRVCTARPSKFFQNSAT